MCTRSTTPLIKIENVDTDHEIEENIADDISECTSIGSNSTGYDVEITQHDKRLIYSISWFVIVSLSLITLLCDLIWSERCAAYFTICTKVVLIYALYVDNRRFIDIAHYNIGVCFMLSILCTNVWLLSIGLVCILFVQIQWLCLSKCILATKADVNLMTLFGMGYIPIFGAMFITIALAYKIGYSSAKMTNIS